MTDVTFREKVEWWSEQVRDTDDGERVGPDEIERLYDEAHASWTADKVLDEYNFSRNTIGNLDRMAEEVARHRNCSWAEAAAAAVMSNIDDRRLLNDVDPSLYGEIESDFVAIIRKHAGGGGK